MNLKILYITLGILSTELLAAQNQTMEMSLEQVVKIARLESPDAQTARHSFRSAYWNYKYYRANYLPSLSLSSDPNLNRAINVLPSDAASSVPVSSDYSYFRAYRPESLHVLPSFPFLSISLSQFQCHCHQTGPEAPEAHHIPAGLPSF